MATVTNISKALKGSKKKAPKKVGIIGASVEQRSKWATKAWKDPELRKVLGQVLKDNAERAKLRAARDRGEMNKTMAARLKVLEAKVKSKKAA